MSTFVSTNTLDQVCNSVSQLSCNLCQVATDLCHLTERISTLESSEGEVTIEVANVFEQQNAGTPPSENPTGGWITRTLNQIVSTSSNTGVSLLGSRIVIQPGTYEFVIRAPAANAGAHRIRLHDVDSNTTLIYGSSASAGLAASGVSSDSVIDDILEITSATQLEVQHQTTILAGAGASFGLPSTFLSTPEIYTHIRIKKLTSPVG